MKNVWELFSKLVVAVKADHAGRNCGHHPFEHALMVAQYCLVIAEDETTGELAAIAGLLHNTDRLFPDWGEAEIKTHISRLIMRSRTLSLTTTPGRFNLVSDAVINHHKKNEDSDSPVLVCLKDADRLANISPFDVIARSARAYLTLPLVDPRFVLMMDPASTYKAPGTVFRDAILSTLEWEGWLRLPKAIGLARPYFEGLRLIQKLTAEQLVETGLAEFPYEKFS